MFFRVSFFEAILENKALSLPHNPDFDDPKKKALKNIVGKGENAGNQHFLFFPQCFLLYQGVLVTFKLSSANAFNLVTSKILSFGKGLNEKDVGFSINVTFNDPLLAGQLLLECPWASKSSAGGMRERH